MDRMSNGLTRRGFTRAALVAGAGLWLPALPVEAQRDVALTGHVVSRSDGTHCLLELFLTHQGRRSVEVLASAAALVGTLEVGESAHPMRLESPAVEHMRRSRAGLRLGRKVPLPPNQEVRYDTFRAAWPAELRAGVPAALDLQVVLRVDPEARPDDERALLTALSEVRIRADVARPA